MEMRTINYSKHSCEFSVLAWPSFFRSLLVVGASLPQVSAPSGYLQLAQAPRQLAGAGTPQVRTVPLTPRKLSPSTGAACRVRTDQKKMRNQPRGWRHRQSGRTHLGLPAVHLRSEIVTEFCLSAQK